MLQVSGATSSAMLQVSGATSNAMPQVSGATPNAMPQPQVSGAASDAMPQPQVSGAVSDAMPQPQVSGATSDAMPQVVGATVGKMLRVSDTTSSVIQQVQSAKSLESLDPSPIRSRSLPRAEQGTMERITQAYERSHRTETHAPEFLRSIKFSSPFQECQGELPGQGSATQVEEAGAFGSGGFSQVSEVASGSSGTPDPRQDITGLRVSVMHMDAKVKVDCVRARANRVPATRVKYSMKYDQPRSPLNPNPLGFSPEPATSKVPQVVRFSPEIGSKESQAPSPAINGQEMKNDLKAQRGRNDVQMDHLCNADREPKSRMFGLDGFLGLKEVQPILCGLLGPDLMTWLSVGKALIVTLYRVMLTAAIVSLSQLDSDTLLCRFD